MFLKLIGIGISAFLLVESTDVGKKQWEYFTNLATIILTQSEVNNISKLIYPELVIPNDFKLPYEDEDYWSEYIRTHMSSGDKGRDTSLDLWRETPYNIMEMDDESGYMVRSAGPDLEHDTDDDIMTVMRYQ